MYCIAVCLLYDIDMYVKVNVMIFDIIYKFSTGSFQLMTAYMQCRDTYLIIILILLLL